MLKFKVGDKIKVISGKDKDRDGTIEKILPNTAAAVIPGLNEYKKHIKPQSNRKGGIFPIPRPIPFSKLRLICPNCSKASRVGFRFAGKEKVRFCKKCNKEISGKK
ncbi:MAG: 50S ribosomal protein L24 [Candidatus Woesebacteria bacterium GW2011_GWA1_39_21]|uniref:Large ribosomal subunit protein uL24 n=1 Tax=Candidatus Woesebacteria bacterium GW2011_GWA1_39_21 TaxID=1618550 RepID=A0A0G0RD49_9BACT|nr:MAG: 50S ribosomal protein L24 [Candidatus Woesebacteria bacterium GW2011_GWA1_39_21]